MAADVVQPQAFVADIKNATSGMDMSDGLSQNTTTGNRNFSTAETSLDNMTESENMTQQQQGGGASNVQTNATDITRAGGNMTNQSQQQQEQQEQNNGNPLSNIPILGELFGR